MSKASEKYGYDIALPERLRSLKGKMSHQAIANAIGESNGQTVNRWFLGTAKPNIHQLIKLARFFNVSTDYLLGMTDCNYPDIANRCGELEERLLLLEAKGRTFDKLLSSIRDISLEYLSELGIDFLLQREVENG